MTTQNNVATEIDQHIANLKKIAEESNTAQENYTKFRSGYHDQGRARDAQVYRIIVEYLNSDIKTQHAWDDSVTKARKASDKTLNENSDTVTGLTKLSLGTNKSRASTKKTIFEECYADGIAPEDYAAHLKKTGEAAILKKARDRKKAAAGIITTSLPKARFKVDKSFVTLGKTIADKTPICEIKKEDLADKVDSVTEKTVGVALVVINPDGSIVVQGLVKDNNLTEVVYEALGNNHQEETKGAPTPEKLEALLAEPKPKLADIEKLAGSEIAKECRNHWEAEKCLTPKPEELPEEMQRYAKHVLDGDRAEAGKAGAGVHDYEKALEILHEADLARRTFDMYLDRPFHVDIDPSSEHIPRLKGSKSTHSDDTKPRKQAQVYKDLLTHRLEAMQAAATMRVIERSVPALDIRAMRDKLANV